MYHYPQNIYIYTCTLLFTGCDHVCSVNLLLLPHVHLAEGDNLRGNNFFFNYSDFIKSCPGDHSDLFILQEIAQEI